MDNRYIPKIANSIILFCPICGLMFEVDHFDPSNSQDTICHTEDCMGTLHIATEEEIEHGEYS
ncbi:hypothetical protein M0R04_08650 [Candidatus Dojkabacteria bacterium]|jgi:hypothetical protein|nr:hypothetical protein [Candidatus Dojkabacteria bacterium]